MTEITENLAGRQFSRPPTPVFIAESAASYRRKLRGPVRAFWAGLIDFDEFWDMFSTAIRTGLTQAWHEGAKRGGILPEELTLDETTELQNAIFGQFGYITRLGEYIEANTQELGGRLGSLFSRLDSWVQAYDSTANRAEAMANGNKKKMWVFGDADHCETCLGLNGKVKRLSFWLAHVMPKDPPNGKLKCGGWRCQCRLADTDKPVSRGPLPMGL